MQDPTLSERDRAFLRHRRRLQQWWPWACAVLTAAVLGLWGYLLLNRSLLVSPWALMQRLEAGDLDHGTLAALAVLGSMAFLTLGIVMLAVLAMLWGATRHERRLLELIRRLGG